MKSLAISMSACALMLTLMGCGPMQSPMPHRLEPEAQKDVDASWNRAFTPIGRFDHQDLLDIMVGFHAYQLGVDTLTFRSEKTVANGKVIMEVFFDRAKPEADRFIVTVLDLAGKVVRTERFTRSEIEETVQLLRAPHNGNEPPEAAARWNRIAEVFPKPKDDVAPPPRPKN